MFFKLSLLALVAPLVSSLQLQALKDATSGGQTTINWTNEAGDPSTFSIFLVNTVFHDNFGIASALQPASGSFALQLPSVPARDGYTLIATGISNITQIFATSPTFSISDPSSASVTPSSTSTTSVSSTKTSSGISRSTTPLSSTTPFGTTAANTNTLSSATTSGSSSASTASVTPLSGAALSIRFSLNKGALSAMFLSAIAGAVVAL